MVVSDLDRKPSGAALIDPCGVGSQQQLSDIPSDAIDTREE